MQTSPGPVETYAVLVEPVMNFHIETSRRGHYHFMTCDVAVATPGGVGGNVGDVKHALHRKWEPPAVLGHTDGAERTGVALELDDAVGYVIAVHGS